jgi:hypothetical protein
MLIMGKSAGPEAALRIAGCIIHPGPFWRYIDESAQFAVWRQVGESAVRGKEPSLIIMYRRDSAYGARNWMGTHGDQTAINLYLVAVHPSGENVDPEQLVTTVVPSCALSQLALFSGAGDRVACHLWLLVMSKTFIRHLSSHRAGHVDHDLDFLRAFLSVSGHASGVTRRVMSCASQPGSARTSARWFRQLDETCGLWTSRDDCDGFHPITLLADPIV